MEVYYLDSNAWINLGCDKEAYQNLINLHLSKKIRVVVFQQVVEELLDTTKVSTRDLEVNKKLLSPFAREVFEDRVFVLGLSKLDTALISNAEADNTYVEHVSNKGQGVQGLRDGIHLLNAMETGAVLVSCDGQVQRTANQQQIPILCVVEFALISNLGGDLRCHGCGAEGRGLAG